MAASRFVLLDRDGTIIVERCYLAKPDQLEFIPGAVEGLRQLSRMGLGLVVLTNQSGVERGFFTRRDLDLVHSRFCEMLAAEHIYLQGLYFCPHRPETGCLCRKPKPGLVLRAAQELGFDPKDAFVVGDKACDVELGRGVGATTFLVSSGYGAEVYARGETRPDHFVAGLEDMALVIQSLMGNHDGHTLRTSLSDSEIITS